MKILFFILKVLFFGASLLMFIPAKLAYIGGADQKTWQPVSATILKSDLGIIEKEESDEINKDGSKYVGFKSIDKYFWDVKYQYNYENETRIREGIYVNLKSYSTKKYNYLKRVKEHKVGSNITVYVNPNDPSEAYIDRRTEGAIETWYKVTQFFFYLSILLFFTPLFRFIYKKYKDSNKERVIPTNKNESTVQRTSRSDSDDGFSI